MVRREMIYLEVERRERKEFVGLFGLCRDRATGETSIWTSTGEDRGGEHARLIGLVAKNFVRGEFDRETFQRRRFESIEFQRRRGAKPCLRIVRKFTRTDGGCRPLRLVVKMTVRHQPN